MTTTPHLAITLVEQSQAQKEITVNEALARIDAATGSGVISRTVSTPPGSPVDGDSYIVGSSATGAWAGKENAIAFYSSGWQFITPKEGMTLWVNNEDTHYAYNGSTWMSQRVHVYTALAGTAHTLDGSYNDKTISFTSASAVVLTLPNDLYVGFRCRLLQSAAGQVTFTPASGATRRNRSAHTKTAGQWAVCSLEVVSNGTGTTAEYVLSGDTSA